jgi:threonine dehydratase
MSLAVKESTMHRPTFQDVLEARTIVSRYLPRTPLHRHAALCDHLGADIRLKHEEYQELGAFKARGGVNLLAHMTDDERRRGVITASTGNHGQSIAYACGLFGAKSVVVLPEGANQLKVQALRNLGAEVIFHGSIFEESRKYAESLADREGYRYVHAINEPLLIAGVGTETLEIVEEFPQVEMVFVPLGGGSGAAGACIVVKTVSPETQVIAVQSAQAPAAQRSFKERRLVQASCETIAEGLATASGYQLAQEILWDLLDDFILVTDDELRHTVGLLVEKAHTLAEPAGVAGVAGAFKLRDSIQGKKVAAVVSGANITPERLQECIRAYQEAQAN